MSAPSDSPFWARLDEGGRVLNHGRAQRAMFSSAVLGAGMTQRGIVRISAEQHETLRSGGNWVLNDGTLSAASS